MSRELLRVLVAFGGALIVALLVGEPYLFALRRLGLRQHIRVEGPRTHREKAGTPTMGGVIILTALSVTLVAMGQLKGVVAWAFLVTLGFGFLGLLDDLLAVTTGRNLGLKARHKLLGQVIMAGLLALYAVRTGLGARMPFPFLAGALSLGPILLFLLSLAAVISSSNAVNLTDGLDGLAAGTVAMTSVAQSCLAYLLGSPAVAVFAAAVAGGCLGFLWFNMHPASVFMGDTGSLALGAAVAATAILSGTTFFLPVVAGVFVVETLSVILQVACFQAFGRRIIRMSPLHHHFELGGWAEEKVVARFCLMDLVLGIIGLISALPALRG